jgi:hypothetical protein
MKVVAYLVALPWCPVVLLPVLFLLLLFVMLLLGLLRWRRLRDGGHWCQRSARPESSRLELRC